MLKFLSTLPFMGVFAPGVVLAANPQIEWRYKLFDFDFRLGVCGIITDGNRLARAAAIFHIPYTKLYMTSGLKPHGVEEVAAACAPQVAKAKLAVLNALMTGEDVVYGDDYLEGKEIPI